MTIIIYSKKRIISQLLVDYIQRHFENIDYCNEVCIKQLNEIAELNSYMEVVSAPYLVIGDFSREEMVHIESLANRENILMLIDVDDKGVVKEKYKDILMCNSIHKLEDYLDNYFKNIVSKKGLELLTGREKEILKLIAKGLLNKEIANELSITERTVKNHISNIFKKINVYDRTQAAVFAIKNKIFSL